MSTPVRRKWDSGSNETITLQINESTTKVPNDDGERQPSASDNTETVNNDIRRNVISACRTLMKYGNARMNVFCAFLIRKSSTGLGSAQPVPIKKYPNLPITLMNGAM